MTLPLTLNEYLNPTALIILALCTYRLTRLIIQDTITYPIRNWIWNKFPPETNRFGYLFTCPWCMSMWVASLTVLGYTIAPTVTTLLALIPALSAVAALITARLDD